MVAVVRRSSFDCCQGGSRKACVCRETLRACDEAITSRRGAKGLEIPAALSLDSKPAGSKRVVILVVKS
jgi:hypothetical protein